MDQRFGAWAQLLTLFRLIYDGGSHGPKFDLPARRGYLFDPSRYAFLEGRHASEDSIAIPRISDGVLHRVLENLLILDGESTWLEGMQLLVLYAVLAAAFYVLT